MDAGLKEIEKELLKSLKLSLGDFNQDTNMDAYYLQKIYQAADDLESDDITITTLKSDLGKTTIVAYATLLIQEKEIATNPTLLYLRNRLSEITKGEKYKNV